MIDIFGHWTYEPNTPEEKKCDMDIVADMITEDEYTPVTDLENLVVVVILHFESETEDSSSYFFPTYDFETMRINAEGLKEFVKASGGWKEFDYYA
jgi:hypothetical protein|nr:MAG TPA: hypothetical protein [Caudoviricetes sp.]